MGHMFRGKSTHTANIAAHTPCGVRICGLNNDNNDNKGMSHHLQGKARIQYPHK